ncbi:MAG TPA: tetratricopeptide repeat protein [Thermoanaerobaculia bacterium]|nr:tetratricopeptide repeat protein [Thermoanaerobaculia bacterium]
MRSRLLHLAVATAVALTVSSAAYATCGGGGGGGTGGMMPGGGGGDVAQPKAYVVPWVTFNTPEAATAVAKPLALYWAPAAVADVRGSDFVSSRALTLASAQCVGMIIIHPEDTATQTKWEVAGKLPVALLVSGEKIVARVDGANGKLRLSDVENMVRRELSAREDALDKQLDEAKKKVAADRDAAIAAYQEVWEQRCLAPKKGRAAQKALHNLGVEVKDAQLRETDPVITPAMDSRMIAAMDRALRAEVAEDYAKARTLYAAASKIDPADPVPYRFLGELYRHHTGEWTLATQTFHHLLTIQPDPLSRAVALHGLGKMTIHLGDSAKGLALFEQSIAVYPLPLTYRNLAVYWNSERVREKANAYVAQALRLAPDDAYNLIFAATYMADNGRADEALRIAKQHENLLSASYNLAAIYALLGQKGKAMELLHRHFYQYERYDGVRAMEMWEARVDYVFASMKDDADFVKLTAMAR